MLVQELDYANLTEPYKATIMTESYNEELIKHQLFISEITNRWLKNKAGTEFKGLVPEVLRKYSRLPEKHLLIYFVRYFFMGIFVGKKQIRIK